MRAVVLSVLMILSWGGSLADAADHLKPAGYVVEMRLEGEDKVEKRAVLRNGGEVPARLMMPLYDGDRVFVRDPKSRIAIELGSGETIEVGGSNIRYEVEGEMETGDSTLSILGAIADVFAGEDDAAPENMVSKGGSLKVPMAVRGSNMLLQERRTLWLGWAGGTAPFALSLVDDGKETVLVQKIDTNEAEITLPENLAGRFTLTLRDAEQQKVTLRFVIAAALPDGVAVDEANSVSALLASAAALTALKDGAWTVEAAQRLHGEKSSAARALLEKLKAGWRYSPTAP